MADSDDTSLLVKLGDVYMTCTEEETVTYDSDVTENAMEDGSDVADHIQPKPTEIHITGVQLGLAGFPQDDLNKIISYHDNAETISYYGTTSFNNCVMTDFQQKQNVDVSNGYSFDITLKVINVVASQYTVINVGTLNIPDIEALKDQIEADKEAKKQSAKVAAGIRVYGATNKGRVGKRATATKKTKTKKPKKKKGSETVLQQIIDMYG